MAQIFDIDAPLDEKSENEYFEPLCPSCSGSDFKIVCICPTEDDLIVNHLICRGCKHVMIVDEGSISE